MYASMLKPQDLADKLRAQASHIGATRPPLLSMHVSKSSRESLTSRLLKPCSQQPLSLITLYYAAAAGVETPQQTLQMASSQRPPLPLLYLPTLLLLVLLVITLHFPCRVQARSSIKVRGTALCDSCQQNRPSFYSLPIYGASITLTCKRPKKHTKSPNNHTKSTLFVTKTTTDQHGAFAFDLPFSKPQNLRGCKVELKSSPFKGCSQQTLYSSRVLSPILTIYPKEKNPSTYSSGWLSLQPNFLPSFCNTSTSFPSKKIHSKDDSFVQELTPFQSFSFPFPSSNTPLASESSSFPNGLDLPSLPPIPLTPKTPENPLTPSAPLTDLPPLVPELPLPPIPLTPTTPNNNLPTVPLPPLAPILTP
ncbi:hypothetical protein GOP47_0008609 [Adiantum capillus-veneris]|uniref:Pollen Ole e 1 allergen and extensin family protein n=1 Tax=Adiantum capillus-veneris TaxID=13818 RepID=A0A9D4UZ09_ADICA|nr:hypothetical protein GOP47_0008609 [Adiantum capillus-veneris]